MKVFRLLPLFLLPGLLFSGGCDLFGDDDDGGGEGDGVLLPFEVIFPDRHISYGQSVGPRHDGIHANTYDLFFDETYDATSFIGGEYAYLVSGRGVLPFVIEGTLVQNGSSVVVGMFGYPQEGDGAELTGTIIWREEDAWPMFSPNQVGELPDDLYSQLQRIGTENWGIDSTDTLEFVVLGRNENAALIWLAQQAPDSISNDSTFSFDAPKIKMGPVLNLEDEYSLERTFEVEGGIDYDAIDRVDFSGDRLPNLVSIKLLGAGAPVYAYVRAPEDMKWYWVGQIN